MTDTPTETLPNTSNVTKLMRPVSSSVKSGKGFATGNLTKKRIQDLEIENNQLQNRLALRTRIRDQFAMAALTGILSNPNENPVAPSRLAETAYVIADAMMDERAIND